MIFVTVGTQLAFDRLIGAVDEWAAGQPRQEVFAQIGPTKLRPRHIEFEPFISPSECSERMRSARVIVAHAGMGTILTALERGKPLVVMPRRAALGEQRNDHQLATVQRFAGLGSMKVALDGHEVCAALDGLDGAESVPPIGGFAPDEFVAGLRAFMLSGSLPCSLSEPHAGSRREAKTDHRWLRREDLAGTRPGDRPT